MPDAPDILPDDEAISDELLLNYLNGNATANEKLLIEKRLATDAFINDALKGLQQVNNKQQLSEYVLQLNDRLRTQLNTSKLRKQKRRLKDIPWIIQAVVIILLLCLLAYFVISFVHSHSQQPSAVPLFIPSLFISPAGN